MIEFYQYDGEEYDHAGTIEDGEVTEGDVDWVLDFVDNTEDVSIDEEDEVIQRVSSEYFVGVIPDGGTLAEADPDDVWMQIYEEKLWTDATDEHILAFSESGLPEFAKRHIREAILAGALFSDFEEIAGGQLMDLRLEFVETLTDDGWTIGQLQEQIQDLEPALSDTEAERIARTETQSVVNNAREIGYKERDDFQDMRFKWVGPSDHRTTETCETIKDRIPDEGVALNELQEVVQETAREFDHNPRKYTPHINCRHTYVRVVE